MPMNNRNIMLTIGDPKSRKYSPVMRISIEPNTSAVIPAAMRVCLFIVRNGNLGGMRGRGGEGGVNSVTVSSVHSMVMEGSSIALVKFLL